MERNYEKIASKTGQKASKLHFLHSHLLTSSQHLQTNLGNLYYIQLYLFTNPTKKNG